LYSLFVPVLSVNNMPKGDQKAKSTQFAKPKMHPLPKRTRQTHHKKGKYHTTGHQRYQCMHCKTYFMETKGTPLYRKHLTEQQITNMCKHLVEKNGIRSIERLTGHHRDTIGTLLEDLAEHATEVSEYLVQNIGLSQFECDELGRLLKKRENT